MSDKLVKNILKNGGGTYNATSLHEIFPDDRGGFWVGAVEGSALVITSDRVADLSDLTLTSLFQGIAARHNVGNVGAWVDEFGDIHLDPSIWVADRDAALRLGYKNKQRSIWDIAAGEAISLEVN